MIGSSPVTYASTKLSYPLFDAEFDPYSRGYLVVAGGGGENKTGVPNRITLLDTSDRSTISEAAEIDLSVEEDSPLSISSLTTKDGLITFAGISNSSRDQKEGKNEHLRSFHVEFPPKKRLKTDDNSQDGRSNGPSYKGITLAGKSSLFKPAEGSKTRVWQRILKLSPVRSREDPSKRIGVIASADAQENEIVIFDATTFLPKQSSVLARIPCEEEAEDLDIWEEPEGNFKLVYCTRKDVNSYSLTCNFDTKTTASVSKKSTCIHSISQSSQGRKSIRNVRWLSSEYLLLLSNYPSQAGAELTVLKLDAKKETSTVVQQKRLPRSVNMAVRLDTCLLDPDPATGEQQVVIAVAAQNKSIHIYTLDYDPEAVSSKQTSLLRPFTVIDTSAQHDQPVSKIVFSNFFAPRQSENSPKSIASEPQYIYLASMAPLSNTVSVESLALTSVPTNPSETPSAPAARAKPKSPSVRWVLSTGKTELLRTWNGVFAVGLVVLIISMILGYLMNSEQGTNIMGASSGASSRGSMKGGSETTSKPIASSFTSSPVVSSVVGDEVHVASPRPTPHRLLDLLHHHRDVLHTNHAEEPTHENAQVLLLHPDHAASSTAHDSEDSRPEEGDDGEVLSASRNPFADPETQHNLQASVISHADADISKLRTTGHIKTFDDLDHHEKELWKGRLEKAGRWSLQEGETILKGILFSQYAAAVAGLANG